MARISFFSWALAGLLAGLMPHHAEGQSVPSPYQFFENRQEAGVFIGASGQGTGLFGYGPSSGLLFGARYGIQLGGPFGLEGVFTYQPTTRDVVDPTRVEGTMVVGEADAEMLTFDARLRFSLTGDRSWRRLNPFLFIGGGMAWDAAGEGEADALVLAGDRFEFGAKFVALLGGGVRWILTDRVLIRADLALTMNRLKTPEGFLDPTPGPTGIGEKEW
ncbi:MAG: hypothetical protein ABIF09_03375, partial [Gemmatimonadota bacterium]